MKNTAGECKMELNKFLEAMNVLKNYCYLDYSKSNEANKRFILFNGNNCNYDNYF